MVISGQIDGGLGINTTTYGQCSTTTIASPSNNHPIHCIQESRWAGYNEAKEASMKFEGKTVGARLEFLKGKFHRRSASHNQLYDRSLEHLQCWTWRYFFASKFVAIIVRTDTRLDDGPARSLITWRRLLKSSLVRHLLRQNCHSQRSKCQLIFFYVKIYLIIKEVARGNNGRLVCSCVCWHVTSLSIHGPDSQANRCVNDLGTGNVSCDEQPLIDRAQNVPTPPISVNASNSCRGFRKDLNPSKYHNTLCRELR